VGLERPGAERRVGAEEADAGKAQRVAADRRAVENAERERAGEVDRERAEREGAADLRGDRSVEQEARERAEPAEEGDAGDDHRARSVATAPLTGPARGSSPRRSPACRP
jgi:hypothetical protein